MSVDQQATEEPDGAGESPTRPPRPASDGTWGLLRPLVLRIHFWAGVLVGPFLLVAALTGLLYTAMPALEPVIYREQLTVPASSAQVPLADQVGAGLAAMPGAELRAVRPGAGPTDTTQVIADAPGLPESTYRTAFVDPHTAQLRGVLDTYGSGQAMPLRGWVDQLHRNLHLGDAGRLYTELAASWLGVLALGGLALWIGLARRRRSLRALAVPRLRGPRRATLLSWHAAVGTWAVVGLLFLSVTGLTWSTYAGGNVTALRSELSWSTPTVATELPGAGTTAPEAGGSDGHAGPTVPVDPRAFDVVADTAAREGLIGPLEITPGAGEAWTATQIEREWPQRLDSLAVDPASGAVLDSVRLDDWPVAATLARWGIDAHMGVLFGPANQLLLAALAVGLACTVVWGYVLWWRRGPGQRAGTLPPGGTLRSLPPGLLVGVVVVTVAVGLALPVLGVSLAVFLLLETLLDRRRTAAEPLDAG